VFGAGAGGADVPVGVDADVRRDAERLLDDGAGIEIGVAQQRRGGGLRERASGADRHQVVLGLDHVAVARDDERVRGVGDAQQRLEAAQAAVGAPVLGQLDGGAHEVAVLLQFALDALE
jgi:hypothetical protein